MDPQTSYARLYRETIPSVVSVYRSVSPAGDGPVGGAGSGFVYDDAGHVLTNDHVVRGVDEVDLRFADGEWRAGTVVGSDAYTDLAVVRVDDLPASAAPLRVAAANPSPGERVAAFGNPMGLDGTMTTGVVSGTSRSTPSGGGYVIPDTVQTDAAINPGNSGGPLVRLDGEVVGVNRAKAGDNIGFAISPALVRRVVPALIERGEYRHATLHVRTVDVSPTVAEANGLDRPGGVLVVHVGRGPAEAVLRACDATRTVRGRRVPVGGDVIVGIDGRRIDSHEELLRYLVTSTEPGQAIDVAVVRDGEPRTETVVLGVRPSPDGRGRDIPIQGR